MSNSTSPSVSRPTSDEQPATASRASVSRVTISSCRPVSPADAVEKRRAIARRAAGLGGDQPVPPHRPVLEFAGTDLQGVDGPVHGIRRQLRRWRRALRPAGQCAKTHQPRETDPAVSAARPAGGNCWCPGRAQHRDPRACRAQRGPGGTAAGLAGAPATRREPCRRLAALGVRWPEDGSRVFSARLAGGPGFRDRTFCAFACALSCRPPDCCRLSRVPGVISVVLKTAGALFDPSPAVAAISGAQIAAPTPTAASRRGSVLNFRQIRWLKPPP
jgi:hypothetical protein